MHRVTKSAFMLFAMQLIPVTGYADKPSCARSLYELETPSGYQHARFAPEPVERFYDGKGFIASIDSEDDDDLVLGGDAEGERLAGPVWVAYHLKAFHEPEGDGFAPGWKRPRDWYKDPAFDQEREHYDTRKRLDNSYDGVGNTWNRGHLAQRADLNRLGPRYGCNSHTFANAIPQHRDLNQGIWLGLENYLSGLANEVGEVWISSGTIFDGPIRSIHDEEKGEIPVAIPDRLWKAAVWFNGDELKSGAWIYPNVSKDEDPRYKSGKCSKDKRYDHQPFVSSIAEIEAVTGLQFFTEHEQREALLTAKLEALPAVSDSLQVGQCR